MTPERWEQVGRIFQAALDLRPGERAHFLRQSCGGDESLRREVESLLAVRSCAGDFLSRGAVEDAARALAGEGPPSPVGKELGRYRVRTLLGAGGMGEVYLADDTLLNRPVALKLISPRLSASEELVRRLRQEALAASSLNHPNILTIHEIGEADSTRFIATEFVEGETLRQRMSRSRLSLHEALDVAIQIASALSAAHRAGVVHRDIKPENVMLREDGIVKVLDFGVAKLAAPAAPAPADMATMTGSLVETGTGMVVGTASYMSPEQARGLAVDARTDVWSLGVVLYEMVAGRLPFSGQTPADRVAAVLGSEPEPLGRLRRGVPPELERIVGRALAKDRDERYARAADLENDLRRLRASLVERGPSRFTPPGPARYSAARTRPAAAALVLSLLAVSLAAAAFVYLRGGADEPAVDSLAVLPLASTSGETEYLSDGITESLINSLSQISSLRVMARSTVFRYKGREVDPRKVGRELGVRSVLTGRVERRGETLVVQADLVDVADGSQLWGGRFDRRLSDVLSVQEEISREIAGKLRPRLSDEERRRVTKHHTENAEAFQLYVNGRFHWGKRTRDGLDKAVEYFGEAIERDPNYALAYAGLADAYALLGIFHVPPRDAFPKAREAALNALRIDDTLAEAHAALGHVKVQYEYDWAGAERAYRRAIDLNPNYANARHFYAFYLAMTGRFDEGLAEVRRAQELEPFSLFVHAAVGVVLFQARRYDEAVGHLGRVLEMNPNFDMARTLLGYTYSQKGMHEQAVAEFQKRSVAVSGPYGFLGVVYARAGRRSDALREADRLRELSERRHVAPYHLAIVYAALGDRDNALEWLEMAYEDRSPMLIWIKTDPALDGLRPDPRFQDIVRRMRLE